MSTAKYTQSWAHMYLKGTHRDPLLYTHQLLSHSISPSYRVTSYTILSVGPCERRGLLCMQVLNSNLCKDKYLPSFSAVLTNEKFAASCLCSPWSVKGRMLWEGVCPLTKGHRLGLYPLVALGKHCKQWYE